MPSFFLCVLGVKSFAVEILRLYHLLRSRICSDFSICTLYSFALARYRRLIQRQHFPLFHHDFPPITTLRTSSPSTHIPAANRRCTSAWHAARSYRPRSNPLSFPFPATQSIFHMHRPRAADRRHLHDLLGRQRRESILVIFCSFAARSISSNMSWLLLLAAPSVASPSATPAASISTTGETPAAFSCCSKDC